MEPDTETLDICLPYALHVVYGGGDFRPEWRTEAVVGLARGIMEDSAFERMPILADALEEAGCTDEALLRHCRDPIPHDHQCWALGLALNRYVPPEPETPPAPLVIEPPRPMPPPRQPTATADDSDRAKGVYLALCWLALVAFRCGGGSSSSPTYTPPAPRSYQPVIVPALEKPNYWSFPPDRRRQELLGTDAGPAAPPPDPQRTPAWLRPKVATGESRPGTR